jgi:hypothetical protein
MMSIYIRIIASLMVLGQIIISGDVVASQELPELKDITASAGIDFRHGFGDQALTNIVESTGSGVAFFDFDGDGFLDIYFVNGAYRKGVSHPSGRQLAAGLHNVLYRNNGDNTFSDVTARAGVGDGGFGMGCLVADYDNDGDRDLFITNFGPNVLYRNNGDGTFTNVAKEAGVSGDLWSVGATFLDFDQDGYLDLYVGNYLDYDSKYKSFFAGDAFPGPLSYPGRADVLYHNLGNGTFAEVSQKAGVYNPQGRAMGVAAADYDNDGDMDIFVANDAMENYLYQNNGDSTFTNVALLSGTGFGENGEATSAMGPEFGDYDNDGLLDLLVPDMVYECLYRNTGRGFFEEVSTKTGLAALAGQYTSWSGNFFDFDRDGLLDIFFTNGDSHFLEPEENLLLLNRNGRTFVDISDRIGPDRLEKLVSRGSATGDIDNDGDLDLVVLNLDGQARLYRSDGGKNHWLALQLRGTMSNRDAIGARISLTAGEMTQIRDVRSSSGYISQSDSRVYFGLGSSATVDKIEIRWPSGQRQTYDNVAGDRLLVITEPGSR